MSQLPRPSRQVIVFLVIVVIGTLAAVVTTAMPTAQPREASAPAAPVGTPSTATTTGPAILAGSTTP
jgi:hypothetical protein